jgi:hypothetical protein
MHHIRQPTLSPGCSRPPHGLTVGEAPRARHPASMRRSPGRPAGRERRLTTWFTRAARRCRLRTPRPHRGDALPSSRVWNGSADGATVALSALVRALAPNTPASTT